MRAGRPRSKEGCAGETPFSRGRPAGGACGAPQVTNPRQNDANQNGVLPGIAGEGKICAGAVPRRTGGGLRDARCRASCLALRRAPTGRRRPAPRVCGSRSGAAALRADAGRALRSDGRRESSLIWRASGGVLTPIGRLRRAARRDVPRRLSDVTFRDWRAPGSLPPEAHRQRVR
jgi:hypothetical protein